ncbi:MAG: helix-turn-helix domain-containing protein, partial [Gemmatimonadaceae bacterium]
LLYRLRVVPIHLPPLRKRPEDVALLANHVLTHYWERHRGSGEASPKISDGAVEFLRTRPWRGNVRELQNVIEQMAVLTEPGHVVQPDDVPIYDDGAVEAPPAGFPMQVMSEPFHMAKDKLIAHFEKEYLAQLVTRAGSNMSKAARLANIDRTTLYRLMEKHGFRRDDGGMPLEE